MQIDVLFNVRKRAEFDTIGLAAEMRAAKRSRGLSVSDVAEMCNVPRTEAEHWFRSDRYNAPPDLDVWSKVKEVLAIEGWECVGDYTMIPNVFEMGARAYHSDYLCPTVTVNNPYWVMV